MLGSTLLTVAIRREILSVLARSDAMSLPAATAEVAARWTARRRLEGESIWAVQNAQAFICQVGADLLVELAARQGAGDPPVVASPRATSGGRSATVSDYVTWEVCIRCGLLAALGWARIEGIGGAPNQILPGEFDCPTGCRLDPDDLVEAYTLAASRTTPRSPHHPL